MITGMSSYLTVGWIGGDPGSAISLFILTLMSSGIQCWYTPLPDSALGREFKISGVEASSLQTGSETTFFLLLLCLLLLFLLLSTTSGLFWVEQGYPKNGFFGFLGRLHLTSSCFRIFRSDRVVNFLFYLRVMDPILGRSIAC